MEVLELTAVQFIKPMSTGRNRPLLLGCEDSTANPFEVVVKFCGKEMDAKAQICELVAAQLADWLGIDVPQAAVVDIPIGFEAVVPRGLEAMVRGSPGANFGSVNLGPSFTTWPVGRGLQGVQRDQASAIFAFDLLLQNPDRRSSNPNLWTRSDRLGVYDHEQAFSFLHVPIIGGPQRPWIVADQAKGFRFMENHVFYPALRGGRADLGPFSSKLEDLSDEAIDGLLEPVPAEWQQGHDLCGKIADYLREAREKTTAFLNFVKHLLL